MIDYQKILEYYLDTDYFFKENMALFFVVFQHSELCDESRQYMFVSNIYYEMQKRIKKEGGMKLYLSNQLIRKYLQANYSDGQFLAIILAHWFGLSEEQLKFVSNKINSNLCLRYLDYFLVHPAFQNKPTEKQLNKNSINYYIILPNNMVHKGKRKKDTMIDCDTSVEYKIFTISQ